MKKNRICPECGSPIGEGERFCGECGAEIKPESPENDSRDGAVIGAGARANITGGITTTSNTHNSVSTSSIDNSTNSTVNNTTIVMGREKDEFCEVCGRPLGKEHAKCPKCGKHICMDCRVPGKNRCLECEKKAVNEYRLTFQQLFTTTGGNIGTAGRQLMDQKARELNVEEEKEGIEEEIRRGAPTQPLQAGKGILVSDSRYYDNMPSGDKGGSGSGSGKTKMLIGIVAAVICIAAVVYFVAIKDKHESEIPVQTEASVPEAPAPNAGTASPASAPEKQSEVRKEPAPAEKTPAKPVSVQVDQKYLDGMKAYENKDALNAISLFKASGSADANYMLGVIYESGCGSVSPNAMMARKYFKAAAEMGHDKAKAKLK